MGPGEMRMTGLGQRAKLILSVAAVAATLGVAGCSDGIDLNGKVFDWLGVSPAAQEAQRREPQIASRAPLVLPPDANRLPEPGSGQLAADEANWPADQEQRKRAAAKERERLHIAYCKGEIQWKERVLNKDESAPRSPYGPCPGLFGGLTESLTKK
jgi:hypothetical protein